MEMLGDVEELKNMDMLRESVAVPERILISKGSWDLCQRLGPILKAEKKEALEWMGFPLVLKNDESYTIRDILVPTGQENRSADTELEDGLRARASKELDDINKKRKNKFLMVGWTHGHSDMDVFHSTTDVDNFKKVLNTVTLNTQKAIRVPYDPFEGERDVTNDNGRIIVKGTKLTDAVMEYGLPGKDEIKEMVRKHGMDSAIAENLLNEFLGKMQVNQFETKYIGFGFSIVWNNRNAQPYAEVGVIEETILSKKKVYLTPKKVEVVAVDVPRDVRYSDSEIEKIVKGRIRKGRYTYTTYANGYYAEDDYAYGAQAYSWNGSTSAVKYPAKASTAWSNKSAPVPTMRADYRKAERDGYTVEELVKRFVGDVMGYISCHGKAECEYSNFLNEMMWSIQSGSPMIKAAKITDFERDSEVGKSPDFNHYWIPKICQNLRTEIETGGASNKKSAAIEFMHAFSNSGNESIQSWVLEKYIPILRE